MAASWPACCCLAALLISCTQADAAYGRAISLSPSTRLHSHLQQARQNSSVWMSTLEMSTIEQASKCLLSLAITGSCELPDAYRADCCKYSTLHRTLESDSVGLYSFWIQNTPCSNMGRAAPHSGSRRQACLMTCCLPDLYAVILSCAPEHWT